MQFQNEDKKKLLAYCIWTKKKDFSLIFGFKNKQ